MGDEPANADGAGASRRQRFEADLDQVRARTGVASDESRMVKVGMGLMGLGVVITIVSYFVSGGQADTRDVLSSVIGASVGVALVIAGAALFLRYSLAQFLRFWLLRLIYEQQDKDPDQR